MKKKMKSLIRKIMLPFIGAMFVIMLLSAPVFFMVAEDAYRDRISFIIKEYNLDIKKKHRWIYKGDEEITQGLITQYVIIFLVMMLYMAVTLRFLSKRLWKSFNETLEAVERFSLEKGVIPELPDTDTVEFERMNTAVHRMMSNSLVAFQTQKEFTENASHELQTPLAIIQSQLDLLIQHPDLTQEQSELVSSLYQTAGHLTRLNKNLLLLAKIENRQYGQDEKLNLGEFIEELLPSFSRLVEEGEYAFQTDIHKNIIINANRILVTSLLTNLITNAIRYSSPGEVINIELTETSLSLSNAATNGPLNKEIVFRRFYKQPGQSRGHGLGLAIVHEIVRYHNWIIDYQFKDGRHSFIISGFA